MTFEVLLSAIISQKINLHKFKKVLKNVIVKTFANAVIEAYITLREFKQNNCDILHCFKCFNQSSTICGSWLMFTSLKLF